MRFGLLLPNAAGPARALDASALVSLGEAAERYGLDSVWASDRLVTPMRGEGGANAWREEVLEPISLLTGIAANTERIEVGTLDCVLPLRNPLFLAKAVSTLDCIAQGRLLFGVSQEATPGEFAALAVEDYYEPRAEVTDEWIAICREMWRESDDPSSFEGAYIRFGYIGAYPKPIRKPHPPIYVRDEGPSALARLAASGDGLILDAASDPAEAVARAREACESAARDFAAIDICAPLPLAPEQPAAAILEAASALGDAGVTHCLLTPGPALEPREVEGLLYSLAAARG
ncbi:MAG: LLM class flavin-dependent oxidoreductase [Chloroflexi bacterium]|nr:LLM class flavin-dependent oxidoreductase [Chloroflexota bacterium]